jgi:hypothetical protein
MGVTSMLARWASKCVHVLIVELPGWDESRMLLEAEIDRRGWRVALSPADADMLAVCGIPGEELSAVSDLLWNQLPGPRTRVSVTTPATLSAMLDAAVTHLVDDPLQREDARTRSRHVAAEHPKPDGGKHEGVSHEDTDHEGMHHGSVREPAGTKPTDMGHGGMEMPMPGGIPLAGGGDDRDGLEMDILNVPLGPVLPHWPAGLVVDCVLQGDVIVSARARVLEAPSMPMEKPTDAKTDVVNARLRIIQLCDHASNLLSLAGWQTAAYDARRLRDDTLRGVAITDRASALERLRRRVERSLLLWWSLKGISPGGTGTGANAGRATCGNGTDVDIRRRLIGWLREAADLAETASGGQAPVRQDTDRASQAQDALAALPELLSGTDLGTARLLVAGIGLDTAALVQAHERAHE